jgi:hypothetical protein
LSEVGSTSIPQKDRHPSSVVKLPASNGFGMREAQNGRIEFGSSLRPGRKGAGRNGAVGITVWHTLAVLLLLILLTNGGKALSYSVWSGLKLWWAPVPTRSSSQNLLRDAYADDAHASAYLAVKEQSVAAATGLPDLARFMGLDRAE